MELKKVVKTTLKVSGALFAAAGVVAVGAVVASGAAVGGLAEGFKTAGEIVKKALGEKEEKKETPTEDMFEEEDVPAEKTATQETVVEETAEAEDAVEPTAEAEHTEEA